MLKTLAWVPCTRGDSEIRVSAVRWAGKTKLELRRWVASRERVGEFIPTREGVSIPRTYATLLLEKLEALRPALEAAFLELERREAFQDDPRERRSASTIPGVR